MAKFTVSTSGTHSFPEVVVGYGAQTALTVTVKNTGTASGTFSVSTPSSDFSLSKSSFTLAAGASTSFTAGPKTGLGAGPHTATVTVYGGSSLGTLSFGLNIIVFKKTYTFALTPSGTQTLPDAILGYGTQNGKVITIKNTGNQAGTFVISCPSTKFTLSRSSYALNPNCAITFTVKPVTGLAAGTHTATVTVSATSFGSQSFGVSFKVVKAS